MAREYGVPTQGQIDKINSLAKRPLKTEDVFVFTNKAIGDGLIPTRFYRVHKNLLEVFKQDARRGVSLMIDHPWAGFFSKPKPAYSFGRTFDAVLKKTNDHTITDETWALFVDHYIVRGREKDGIKNDELIADIEDGTIFDTSIGFGNDKYECSICGKDYFSCEHYAGGTYDDEVCTIILKPPGFLMEDSLVFDGAYPGAGVLSVLNTKEIENNFDVVDDIKGLAVGTKLLHTFSERGGLNTFKYHEPVKGIIVPETFKTEEECEVDEKVVEQEVKGEEINGEVLVEALVEELKVPKNSVSFTDDALKSVFGEDVPADFDVKLVQMAKEAKALREELINETIEWGIRAKGNDFAKESWLDILKDRSIETIRGFKTQFEKEAKEVLNAGRVTEVQVKETKTSVELPAEAYKI